jgi:hypothetical protein
MEASTEHFSVHTQQCAMLEFFTAEGVCLIEIYCQLQVVYDDDS